MALGCLRPPPCLALALAELKKMAQPSPAEMAKTRTRDQRQSGGTAGAVSSCAPATLANLSSASAVNVGERQLH
jgi:hypothetical protein